MSKLKIGDRLWHPMAYDVIEHKIIGVREYESGVQYETESIRNVGASYRLQLLLSHIENKIIFIGYVYGEDSVEYESGLQDFVEGYYYTDKLEAELKHYDIQRLLVKTNMDNKKRLYDQAKNHYDRYEKLINDVKEKTKQLEKLKNGNNKIS